MRATDKALDKSRGDADAVTLEQRDATDAGGGPVDPAVVLEREVTDATLEAERKDADRAIERERALRRALEKTHRHGFARLATDKDLATERDKSDDELSQSSWLLSEERAAHDDTRLALTTRDEFLAIVSHDLRSPLTAVLAGTTLLAKAPALAGADRKLARIVDGMRRNAASMLRLISDLLDIERLTAGKFEVKPRDQDLGELVRQAADVFESQAAEKSLILSVELPADPVVSRCDGDRILQVITNLLDNAVKFTGVGGSVVVTLTKTGSRAQVSVGDTGPGIPEADRARIFERFSQLSTSGRTGLGLGLYIAKAIIGAHGGQLWVASAQGQGSVFSFALALT